MSSCGFPDVRVGTVDGSQGDEETVQIIDRVRMQPNRQSVLNFLKVTLVDGTLPYLEELADAFSLRTRISMTQRTTQEYSSPTTQECWDKEAHTPESIIPSPKTVRH